MDKYVSEKYVVVIGGKVENSVVLGKFIVGIIDVGEVVKILFEKRR